MAEEATEQEVPKELHTTEWTWHRDELLRYGFTRAQRRVLLDMMDAHDLELVDIRYWIEVRGWTCEQAFLNVA